VIKIIQYLGQPCKVACDEKCTKAWGINRRPFELVSEAPWDIVWLSDNELGDAPDDPGTYEGGQANYLLALKLMEQVDCSEAF